MVDHETSSITGVRCIFYAGAVIAGAFFAWLISAPLFRALPSDMTRISVLLDALQDEILAPELIAFGDSIAMASVDMAVVSEKTAGSPRSYNFASTGQSPIESYLYYQNLPSSTKIIVQIIQVPTLSSREALNEQKYNAFYMYGYRPDRRTRARMTELLGDEMRNLIDKSDLQHRFESRWATRQRADYYARSAFRADLNIERSTYDLTFPRTGARRLPPRLFKRDMDTRFANRSTRFNPNQKKIDFLDEICSRIKEDGRQLVLVLAPTHSDQIGYRSEAFYAGAREIVFKVAAENNTIILDGTNVVSDDLYVDAVHPGEEGAAIFSNWLANELNQLQAAGRLEL